MYDNDNSHLCRTMLDNTGIQSILNKPGITEVAINQPGRVWFDCGNDWEFIDNPDCSLENLTYLANSLAVYSNLGRPLDFNNPIASVVLPDGERGQIIMAPAAENKTVSITIRKPSMQRFTLDDYVNTGRLSGSKEASGSLSDLTDVQKQLITLKKNDEMGNFFKLAIKERLNILIVGGTGSGKTTVMKSMADLYPRNRRIFTVEDVHELDLPNHPNHLHLFYKSGGVSPKTIIESCMRMKPDHVFLAELRGDETWNYLEMLNTGHAGSLTTIHANDCYSAFSRMASLVKQSEVGQTLDYEFIMKTVKSSIDIICFFDHTFMKEIYFNPEEKNNILSGV